jgi:hypothetical protein
MSVINDQFAENTIKRVRLIEEIEAVKEAEIAPRKKQIADIDRANRSLYFERNQERFDFQDVV